MKCKLKDSKPSALFLIFAGIFLLMLFCNMLTLYAVDDFNYSFSFATAEPLASVWQIFPSMAAHAQTMNGRLSAHFLVQLFMLMPKWMFDVVNAGMFCLQIALICRFGFTKQKNGLCVLAVFCGFWLWQLAFGQVNLWQDGAVNYLWSVVFMLLFLYPFAKRFMMGEEFSGKGVFRFLFLLFSLFAGSYSETASAAGIFVAAMLLVLDAFCNRRPLSKYGVICVVFAVLGYISIYLAPGEWMNKSGETTLMGLFRKFEQATALYASAFGVLATAFAVLLVMNFYAKERDLKRMLLGIALVLGSLAANYIMIFAHYYPERTTVAAFVLLMAAVAVLLPPIAEDEQWKVMVSSAMVILIVATLPHFVYGIKDIATSYYHMRRNEKIIVASVADGKSEVELIVIHPATKYSPIYELKYLDTEDPTSWPNDKMAKYFGIDSIIGVP